MARVVCQALVRPDRITFIWSEQKASFEPYHLTGPEAAELHRSASEARASLARLANLEHASDADMARVGLELARAGHRLHQQLFAGEAAVEVREWLKDQVNRGSVECLEFLGAPGLLPWTILCDSVHDEHAFHGADAPGWKAFWGIRHDLTSGRRVGPLRRIDWLVKPPVLLVIDPQLRESLPEPQRKRLLEFVEINQLPTAETFDQFVSALRSQAPEIVYFFCRASADGLRLAGTDLSVDDLQEALCERGEGPDWNGRLLFVNACQAEGGTSLWTPEHLHRLGVGGVFAPEEPLPAAAANAFGLEFLAALLYARQPVGKLMQSVRGRTAPLGLLYQAACPPAVRVSWQEDELDTAAPEPLPPLPDTPYRPFMPYDDVDRALFVGRDDDTAAVAGLLDADDTRIVVLHGRRGVGKSSLVRAGLLPYLEDDSVGYRALRDRSDPVEGEDEADSPVLTVRATFDLPGQLASAMTAYCARPYVYTTPAGRTVTVDLAGMLHALIPSASPDSEDAAPSEVEENKLRSALCKDPALLCRCLNMLGECLPFEHVVLVEQAEEIFTLAQGREGVDAREDSLEMLRRMAGAGGAGKVVLSIRDYYSTRLISALQQGLRRRAGVRDYDLQELDSEAMFAALEQPTLREPIAYSSEIPFEVYGFRYAPGLLQRLIGDARAAAREHGQSALTLLQVLCAQLAVAATSRVDSTATALDVKRIFFQSTDPQAALLKTSGAFGARLLMGRTGFLVARVAGLFGDHGDRIGGVEGGLAKYMEQLFKRTGLRGSDRRRLRSLIPRLMQRDEDGSIMRSVLPLNQLITEWRTQRVVDRIVEAAEDESVRLVETLWLHTREGETAFLSLADDGLASVAAAWQEARKSDSKSWSRAIDFIWIAVPVLILTIVFFYVYYVRPYNHVARENEELGKLVGKEKVLEAGIKAGMWPTYLGQISLAAEAWKQGDTLRSRQHLLMLRGNPRGDLRGFEWYYLWQLAHNDLRTMYGQRGPVTGLALAPEGKVLASVGQDGKVRIWDMAEGTQESEIAAGIGSLNCVAFSQDGKRLAVGAADNTLKVWEKGEEGFALFATLKGHDGPVLASAFSKDGTLASASADGTVRLWDVAMKKERKVLKEHSGPVVALAYAPDGKLFASGTADQVILWDDAGARKQTLKTPGAAVAFSPDGKLLATAGARSSGEQQGGAVAFWDPADGKEKGHAHLPSEVAALAFSKDGKTLAAGGKDFTIRLHDVVSTKELKVLRGHLGWASAVLFTPDGASLVTASYDSTIKQWPAAGPAPDALTGHEGPVWGVAVSPDNRLAASAGQDGSVKLWRPDTGKKVRTLKDAGGPVRAVAFGKSADRLIVAAAVWSDEKDGGKVVVWDAVKGKKLHTLKANGQPLAGVAFSPSGDLIAAAGAEGTLVVWDAAKATLRTTLKGHKRLVRAVAFAPDGKLLASGGADGKVKLWPLSSDRDPTELVGHTGEVTAVAFSPDGKELVSASFDRSLRRWDVASAKTIAVMRGHSEAVLSAAYSRKGDAIVSGGADATIRLWDVLRSQERFAIRGSSSVRGVAFSPDRRTLVSGDNDGTVRLWRAAEEETADAEEREPPPPEPQEP